MVYNTSLTVRPLHSSCNRRAQVMASQYWLLSRPMCFKENLKFISMYLRGNIWHLFSCHTSVPLLVSVTSNCEQHEPPPDIIVFVFYFVFVFPLYLYFHTLVPLLVSVTSNCEQRELGPDISHSGVFWRNNRRVLVGPPFNPVTMRRCPGAQVTPSEYKV